jgi:hypothetical protein
MGPISIPPDSSLSSSSAVGGLIHSFAGMGSGWTQMMVQRDEGRKTYNTDSTETKQSTKIMDPYLWCCVARWGIH